jgi:integrase
MFFKSARRDGVCLDNAAEFIRPVRASAKSDNKRPFSIAELQAILAVADAEWRSLILFGPYSGQRLGDLVSLTWNNIDLERDEVRLVTSKTSFYSWHLRNLIGLEVQCALGKVDDVRVTSRPGEFKAFPGSLPNLARLKFRTDHMS